MTRFHGRLVKPLLSERLTIEVNPVKTASVTGEKSRRGPLDYTP